ncbi:MAG: hypothetical protein CM1200mP20_15750 [Pseudomonadota bacterium]|nr:MAG: hypothetical protein CM1200mP20_15750 [Pseudomonadota bacterium]
MPHGRPAPGPCRQLADLFVSGTGHPCYWQRDRSPLLCRSVRVFLRPRSKDDLLGYLSDHPQATLLSGAPDIGLWITKQGRRLSELIFLVNWRNSSR